MLYLAYTVLIAKLMVDPWIKRFLLLQFPYPSDSNDSCQHHCHVSTNLLLTSNCIRFSIKKNWNMTIDNAISIVVTLNGCFSRNNLCSCRSMTIDNAISIIVILNGCFSRNNRCSCRSNTVKFWWWRKSLSKLRNKRIQSLRHEQSIINSRTYQLK